MEQTADILLVDNDPALLRLLTMRLSSEGFSVVVADSSERALEQLASKRIKLVITDLSMDSINGLQLFHAVRHAYPQTPVILITNNSAAPEALSAMRHGVFALMPKPLNKDELVSSVRQALGEDDSDSQAFAGFITCSGKMQAVIEQAKQAAKSDSNVLIFGAPGTGKETMARAIHMASSRRAEPFVTVDCGSLPDSMIAIELFGCQRIEKEANLAQQLGALEAVGAGTLFLKHVGELGRHLQEEVLDHLPRTDFGEVAGFRVMSSTDLVNKSDLLDEHFSDELYYRLNAISVRLPRLVEREEDIALLAENFAQRAASRQDKTVRFSAPALKKICEFRWPGNVRQLEQVVEQSVLLTPNNQVISSKVIGELLAEDALGLPSLSDAKDQFEREYVVKLLELSEGNVTRAAKLARRNRSDFHRILSRHHIDSRRFLPEGK